MRSRYVGVGIFVGVGNLLFATAVFLDLGPFREAIQVLDFSE